MHVKILCAIFLYVLFYYYMYVNILELIECADIRYKFIHGIIVGAARIRPNACVYCNKDYSRDFHF